MQMQLLALMNNAERDFFSLNSREFFLFFYYTVKALKRRKLIWFLGLFPIRKFIKYRRTRLLLET